MTSSTPADSLFEFLHMEMVDYVLRTMPNASKDDVYYKLEALGFRVGQSLAERYTRDGPRLKDQLEVIKFICKDFWTAVYKKQIDNLRTNHRGVYVLQDNKFKLFTQISDSKQYMEKAAPLLAFPCGLIRGALVNLDVSCIVSAEVSQMPICTFTLRITS
eukprot:Colp12_sorted_trinity150504_noHs@15300